MKKISLASSGFELVTKRARKRVFLDEMSLVVVDRIGGFGISLK